MTDIAIFGAGGFGREVKMLIEQINTSSQQYELIGFFYDSFDVGTNIHGVPVLGGVVALNAYKGPLSIVFAIGNPAAKKKIISKVDKSDLSFPALIHPSCWISNDNVQIGEGCIICAGVIITTDIHIGSHVILNLSCTVGHDTTIGDFSSFMPSVNISGEVNIGEGVYCGTGAKIINQLEIGENTIIGAGAVVSKSLPANCTAVGIPAKPIKFHEPHE